MKRQKTYFIYIMASSSGTLYIGISSRLEGRTQDHKNGVYEGFSKKYRTDRLVYFERYSEVGVALAREEQLKNWRREKKIKLIASMNPSWKDLSKEDTTPVPIFKK